MGTITIHSTRKKKKNKTKQNKPVSKFTDAVLATDMHNTPTFRGQQQTLYPSHGIIGHGKWVASGQSPGGSFTQNPPTGSSQSVKMKTSFHLLAIKLPIDPTNTNKALHLICIAILATNSHHQYIYITQC